jgi:hypothetical protein
MARPAARGTAPTSTRPSRARSCAPSSPVAGSSPVPGMISSPRSSRRWRSSRSLVRRPGRAGLAELDRCPLRIPPALIRRARTGAARRLEHEAADTAASNASPPRARMVIAVVVPGNACSMLPREIPGVRGSRGPFGIHRLDHATELQLREPLGVQSKLPHEDLFVVLAE